MLTGSWVAALHPQTFVQEDGADPELFGQLAFPLDSLTGGLNRGLELDTPLGCYPSSLAVIRLLWLHSLCHPNPCDLETKMLWLSEREIACCHKDLCPAQAGDTNVIQFLNWTMFLTFWSRCPT